MKKLLFTLIIIASASILAFGQSASWVAQTTGVTNNLRSIYFTDANIGFAVGESGRTLKTIDGGATWTASSIGTNSLYSTCFVNSTTGWAVGLSGVIYKTSDALASVVAQTSGTTLRLNCVQMNNSTNGWVVGNTGTILKTTTGGISWANKTSGTTSDLYATYIINDNNVWFCGFGGKIMHTVDGGATFTTATSGTTNVLYSIYFADANTGWAVGLGGIIIKTTDGGTTWTAQTSGITTDLYSVRFADANRGWAVGANGVSLYTMNGGTNWVAQTSLSANSLYSVYFREGYSTGWVAGNTGSIYKTTSAGNEWVALTSGTTADIAEVDFYGTTSGLAVGAAGSMYKTTNSGSTWTPLSTGTTNNLNAIDYFSSTQQIAVGSSGTIIKSANASSWTAKTSGTTNSLLAVRFYDVNNGIAAGSGGTILKTIDGGETWTNISVSSSYSIQSICYVTSSVIFAIGTYTSALHVIDGIVLKSTNGGTTWTGSYTNSTNLYCGYFYNSSIGWVAGSGGKIVKTVDGGTTWTTLSSQITNTIYSIGPNASSNTTLWAFASGGTIIKTLDGGTTWTKQLSGTSNNLTSGIIKSSTVGYAVGNDGTIIKMHDAYAIESVPNLNSYTYCRNATIAVTNSISGTFYADNAFYLQLSNSSGTFTSPATVIGSSTTNIGGTITGTIPSDAIDGTAYKIRVVSTNPYIIGPANTSNITISVPASSISPSGTVSICQGSTLTLTANSGTGPSYQWKKDGTIITGATAATYSASAAGSYTVLVSNTSGCSILSSATTVNVNTLPTATITPGGATTFCTGGSVVLTANTGTGYTYRWMKDGTQLGTSQSYTASTSGNYIVQVTNTYGCVATSAITTVVVNTIPTANITPVTPAAICAGSSVVLTASTSAGYTYVWKKDGITISGATTQTYSANSSGNYSVVITNSNSCSAISNTAPITVNPLPTATATAGGPTSFCDGGSVVLTAGSGTGYLYQWEKDDNTIDGANSISYSANQAGNYSVVVTDGNSCSSTFYSISVAVNSYPTANVSASGPIIFCEGGSVTLNANTGAGYTYQWTKNNAVISGSTSSSFLANQVGVYRVIVTNSSGCATTSTASSITVNPLPTASISAASATTFCSGGSVALNANTGVGLTYIWKKDLIDIATATSAQYTATQTGSYTLLVNNGTCSNISYPIQVVSNANPAASINYNGSNSICTGSTLSLHANRDTGLVDGFESGDMYKNPYVMSGSLPWKIATNIYYQGSNSAKSGNILDNQTSEMSLTLNLASPDSIIFYRKVGSEANYDYLRFYIDGTEVGNWSGTIAWTRTAYSVTSGTHSFKWAYTKDGSTSTTPDCAWIDNVDLKYNSNIIYQWQKDGTTIYGANGSTYIASQSGNYTVTTSNNNGCSSTSATTYVNVNSLPDATVTAATPLSFCSGSSVTLFVNSFANLTYQWLQEGANISGATNSAYVANMGGNYSVLVTNTSTTCSAYSSNNPVSVYPLPTVDAGSDISIFNGASTILSVSASGGSSPYTYLWTPASSLNSATSSSPTTTNLSTTTVFSVTATDNLGCTGNDNVVVSVTGGALSASATTSTNAICLGNSATLIAGASGGSGTYNYSWTSTSGFTSSSANPVVTPTATTTYSVAVNDGTNSSTSSVIITVYELPISTITPSGPTTFCNGNSVVLAAPGMASYSYVWKKDGNIMNGENSDSIIATLEGIYRVFITDNNGCEKASAFTTVTVNNAPNADITANGLTSFCESGSVILSGSSNANHTFQWYKDSVLVIGATNYQYQASQSGSYNLVVTGTVTGCSRVSNAVSVNVFPTPVITIGTTGNTSFCEGGSVGLVATTIAPTILWYKDNAVINGATFSSYAASTSGNYSAYTQDANGCFSYSTEISVSVHSLPDATITPGSATTFCDGGSAVLSAPNNFTNQYQWFVNGSPIGGAQSYQYTASNSGFYTVSVTDTYLCSQNSAGQEIKINYPPSSIVTVTGNTSFCSGDSVLLSAPISTGYTYQWNKNGLTFTGSNNSSIYATQSGDYTLMLADSNGCTSTSSVVTVTVNTPPVVSLSPSGNISMCEGQVFEISTGMATGYTYQWFKDGVELNGAIFSSYYPTETAQYSVNVTSNAGCIGLTTTPINITINPLPQVSIVYQGNTNICSGGSILLQSSAVFASYTWYKNGVIISSNDSITATEAGLYTLSISDANSCSVTSSPVTVSINPSPIAQITFSSPLTFCQGDSVVISAADEPGYQYQWKKNSSNIQNANSNSFSALSNGNYSVEITNSNGCLVESAAYPVTVATPPNSSLTIQGSGSICSGSTTELSALPSGNYQYFWFRDGNSFSNSMNTSYNASLSGSYTVIVKDINGCSDTTNAVSISVKPLPSTTLTYTGTSTFCQGDSLILHAASGLNYAYLWMNEDSIIDTTFTNSYAVFNSGNFSVQIYDTITGCNSTSSKVSANMGQRPSATIIPIGNTSVCEGNTVQLIVSSGSGNTYQWYRDGALINGSTSLTIYASQSGAYSVMATNSQGCSYNSPSEVVKINLKPIANAGSDKTISNGSSTTLSGSATSGTTPYSFSWTPSGLISSGANTNNPHTINLTSTNAFTLVVSDSAGCTSSDEVTVFVTGGSLSVSILPSASSVCLGGNSTLTSTPTGGSGTFTYSWSSLPAGFSSSLSNPDVSPTVTTTYSVTVSDGFYTANSYVVLTVNPKPTATVTHGANTSICEGGSIPLNANTGAGLTYQWTKNGADIQGENSSTYAASETGSFAAIITNTNGCSSTSNTTAIVVNPLPDIFVSTAGSTTFCQGEQVVLHASSGLSVTYQWKKNGMVLVGQTADSLAVSQQGNYTVAATSTHGCSSSSANLAIIVNSKPNAQITVSGNTSFCEGGSTTLLVGTGSDLTYQWNLDNILIYGATSSSLIATTSGMYSVDVTNITGCLETSSQVEITSLAKPLADAGSNINIANGSTAQLNGNVTGGSGIYSVYWTPALFIAAGDSTLTPTTINLTASTVYTLHVIDSTGCQSSDEMGVFVTGGSLSVQISSAVNALCSGSSVQLNAIASGGSGSNTFSWSSLPAGYTDFTSNPTVTPTSTTTYTVEVTDGFYTSTNSIIITVDNLPSAVISPASSTTICSGNQVTLNATTGSGLTYQWKKDNMAINGANSSAYQASESGLYSVVISTTGGCFSESAQETVIVNPVTQAQITTPGSTVFCFGNEVVLNATIGSGLSYQWKKNNVNIAGAVGSSYTAVVGGNYSVIVYNEYGCTSTSSSIAITAIQPPSAIITVLGGNATICQGDSVALLVGTGNGYKYQWKKDGVDMVNTNSASVTINNGGNYTVLVTDTIAGCFAESLEKTIIVNPAPQAQITTQGNTTFCSGSHVIISTITGTNLAFAWKKDNVTIAGADSSSISASVSGSYSVVILNEYACSSTSNSISVIVYPTPAANITVVGGNTTICQGDSVAMLVGTGNGYAYQWKKDGIDITGSTAASVTVYNSGTYTVVVTDSVGSCFAESNAVAIVTKPTPDATVTLSGNPTICEGDTVNLNAVVNANYNYQWKKDGFNIANETANMLAVIATGNYELFVSDAISGCSSLSLPKSILVNTNPTPAIVVPGSITLCTNNSVTLSTVLTYTYYNWSTGQTSATTDVTAGGNYSVSVTDANGCHGVASDSVSVYTIPATEICMVTADSATSTYNVVVWEKPTTSLVDSFIVYREFAGNVYQRIGSVPYDSLGVYNDYDADPRIHQWRYKLSAKDTCGNESPLSNAHATMFLQLWIGISNETSLDWSFYEGYYFPYYYIYKGATPQTLALYDSVASTSHGYNDFNIMDAYYRVFFSNPSNCNANKVGVEDGFYSASISNLEQRLMNKTNQVQAETMISLNPNPANSKVTITMSKAEKAEVTILSGEGQKIRSLEIADKTNELAISDLARGVYFIQIKTDRAIKTLKLVKN